MVRRKIKIKRIENSTTRQVTFSKRRGGLLKKAHDLSVLCDVEVGVIVFSSKGKLFQFASPSMQSILKRYQNSKNTNSLENGECEQLTSFTKQLTSLQSNLMSDDLEHLSLRDIILLEQEFLGSLGRIRAKKAELLLKELEEIKEKAREARGTTQTITNILEKLVDSCPSDVVDSGNAGGEGDCEHGCTQEAPQKDASLSDWVNTSERSNLTPDGPSEAISEDVTQSLVCMDDE